MSFNEAVVFPLCVSTAAAALFTKEFLGLPFPKLDAKQTNDTILICGGSSCVGSNAIQLARGAGLRVVTTCSPRNFDLVKDLGADEVFDYNSKTFVDDVVQSLDQSGCVATFNAAGDVGPACQISHKCKAHPRIVSATMVSQDHVPDGVDAKWLYTTDAAGLYREISPATFAGFLPEALAKGIYKVAPKPSVVSTKGINGIQEGLDILRKGVSGRKIVIEA